MDRRTRSRLLLLSGTAVFAGACAVVAACSPANPQPSMLAARPVPLARDAGPPASPYVSPARWALGYAARWRPDTSLAVGDGATLWVGEGGERWVHKADATEAAPTLLPERIVGVQRADASYRFVGQSGAVYLAREPLGVARRVSDAVPGAKAIAVGKSAILVVDQNGDLVRSTDGGRAWAKVVLPQRDGIVVGVAMNDAAGLVVLAPQRLYGTKDDGATWVAVKSPGVGVSGVIARDGSVWLEGPDESLRFDPAWGTFTAAPGGGRTRPARPPVVASEGATTLRYLDGKHALEIDGTRSHDWTVSAGELGSMPTPKPLPELDGCEFVNGAVRGETVVLACDAHGTVAGGIDRDAGPSRPYYYGGGRASGTPDGGTVGFVTKIFRSDDGGRTYREDATVEGGVPQPGDQAIAVGEGDWLYLGMRCGLGYAPACLPARVRASRSNPWTELPVEESRTGQVRFATSSLDTSVYSVGVRDDEAYLFQWKAGAATAEPVGRLAGSLELPASVSLSIDEDGAVRGFVRGDGKPRGFVFRQGQGITSVDLPADVSRAAFSGEHGVALARGGKALETGDGGKTWSPVAFPAFVAEVDACSTFGCITNRGFRVGWDVPPPAATAQVAAGPVPRYAKPLRCSAKDRWVALGGGTIPGVANVDHAGVRWEMPVRGKDGRITLLVAKRGDPTTRTTAVAMMGPAPGPPLHGSGTTMHVQPDGVVVLRYSYLRKRTGLGRYNPVDAEVAWYRDATGKIGRGKVLKNPSFRVNRDPQAEYEPFVPPYRSMPEVLALGPRGVYFHSMSFEDEGDDDAPKPAPFVLLRDDGRTEKLKFPAGEDDGTTMVVTLDGATDVLVGGDEIWSLHAPNGARPIRWAVMGGLQADDAPVQLVSMGGKPVLAATAREAGRAWGIPLLASADLGPTFALPTQRSLGDVPTPCDGAPPADPNAVRFDAPWVMGSRHPLIVDVDGVAHVLATDRAEIRGSATQPGGCAAAFDARLPGGADAGDSDWGAIVFLDDLSHSLVFRADTGDWPAQISVRPMECQFTAGPLPESLQDVDGFVPPRGPSP